DSPSNWYEVFVRLAAADRLECFPELLQVKRAVVGRHALLLHAVFKSLKKGDLLEAVRQGIEYLVDPLSAELPLWQVTKLFEQLMMLCVMIYPYTSSTRSVVVASCLKHYVERWFDFSTAAGHHLKTKGVVQRDPDPVWYSCCELIEWALLFVHDRLASRHTSHDVKGYGLLPILHVLSTFNKDANVINSSGHLRQLWDRAYGVLPGPLKTQCQLGLRNIATHNQLLRGRLHSQDTFKLFPYEASKGRGFMGAAFAPPSTPERAKHQAASLIQKVWRAKADQHRSRTRWTAARSIARWWLRCKRLKTQGVVTSGSRLFINVLTSTMLGPVQPVFKRGRAPYMRTSLRYFTSDTHTVMSLLYRCFHTQQELRSRLNWPGLRGDAEFVSFVLESSLLLGRIINNTSSALLLHVNNFYTAFAPHFVRPVSACPVLHPPVPDADIFSVSLPQSPANTIEDIESSSPSFAASSSSSSPPPSSSSSSSRRSSLSSSDEEQLFPSFLDLPKFLALVSRLVRNFSDQMNRRSGQILIPSAPEEIHWEQKLQKLKKREKNFKRAQKLEERNAALKKMRRLAKR
ncbi:MAG: hypothetical protein Q8P67_25900, partial [archaeon]|nr:hypothetical protein [archaeon]